MKAQTVVALATAALFCGITAASAALLSSARQAYDSLSLSRQQQRTAWNDLKSRPVSTAPPSFLPTTSTALPSTVTVNQIPAKTAGDVPALRPYDFAKVQGKLLIVNPKDMMIAEIITD